MKTTSKHSTWQRILSIVLSVQLLGASVIAAPAAEPAAKTFTADGLDYQVITPAENGASGTVQLGTGTPNTVSGTALTIPAQVTDTADGSTYDVVAIAERGLAGNIDGLNSLNTVTVPASVTSIGDRAFSDQTSLNTVTFAEGSKLTAIGKNAFDSTGLRSIQLPAKLETLGDSAFNYCRSLTSVTLPEGLVSIGSSAFNSTKLAEITLPASLTTLGDKPFEGCTYLKSIDVAAGNTAFASDGGVLYDAAKTTLLTYPLGKKDAAYTVPATVTAIAPYAAKKVKNLAELTLPDSLTTIGRSAFDSAANLETVTFGSKLTTIGYMAFYNCRSLGAVTLPASVTSIEGYAFNGCSSAAFTVPSEEIKTMLTQAGASAESITVEAPAPAEFAVDGITYKPTGTGEVQVGNGTDNMAALEGSITIPASVENGGKTYAVTAVGDKAFWRADKLTAVSLPETITAIGEYAFSGTGITAFAMPAAVTSIGVSAFSSCAAMEEITLSGKLTAIPTNAFWSAGLRTVTVPEGVTSIGEKAFNTCANLQTVSLPASLTDIAPFAFWSDEALRSVTLAEGSRLTTIGESAFAFDSTLKTINLPACVTTIGKSAFSHCTALSSIGLGTDSQLVTLGENAFSSTSLTSFHYPASLTTVGSRPLDGCEKLTTITVAAGNPKFSAQDGVLLNKAGTTLIQYPAKKSGSTYTIPAGVTTISEYAFQDCKRVIELTIPDGVTTVSRSAFKDCAVLSTVTMADSVTSLGYLCFYNCPALETVKLSSGVTKLGEYVFYNCQSLAALTIPAGVTAMEQNVFGSCSALEAIDLLPTGMESVASGAFNGISETAQITVHSAAVKDAVIASGFPAERITLKEETPKPVETTFVVDGITYKVLTQPTASQPGTVSVGDGVNGLTVSGSVTIPAVVVNNGHKYQVTAVSNDALQNSTITALHLPDTVKVLEEGALQAAPELLSFEIPAGVESIGVNAISDCGKLKSITYAPGSKLTTLGSGALAGNAMLESIALPNTLTTLGTFTMYWNNALREVTFQPGFSMTSLPEGTFMRDFALEKINNLPALTEIGRHAFYHCEKLSAIDLSAAVSIGEQAFFNCYALESIALNDALTTLESGTFFGCRSLKQVKLGSGLTTLGAVRSDGEEEPVGVFENCTALTSITLGQNAATFGKSCFKGCSSLAEIRILAPQLKAVGANAFYELAADAKLYVVNESVKDYLVRVALVEPQQIVVMGDQPEPPVTADVSAASAALRAETKAAANGDAAFTLSLTDAKNISAIEVTFDSAQSVSAVGLNGFLLMGIDGNVATLVYEQKGQLTASGATDVVRFTVASEDDVTIRVTGLTIAGRNADNTAVFGKLLGAIDPNEATFIRNIYDLNKDNVVNLLDLVIAQDFYLVSTDDSSWSSAESCDFNGDGIVNVADLVDLYNHFTRIVG